MPTKVTYYAVLYIHISHLLMENICIATDLGWREWVQQQLPWKSVQAMYNETHFLQLHYYSTVTMGMGRSSMSMQGSCMICDPATTCTSLCISLCFLSVNIISPSLGDRYAMPMVLIPATQEQLQVHRRGNGFTIEIYSVSSPNATIEADDGEVVVIPKHYGFWLADHDPLHLCHAYGWTPEDTSLGVGGETFPKSETPYFFPTTWWVHHQ